MLKYIICHISETNESLNMNSELKLNFFLNIRHETGADHTGYIYYKLSVFLVCKYLHLIIEGYVG